MTVTEGYTSKGKKTPSLSGFMSPTVCGILASYKCTAHCRHCCFNSQPGKNKRLSMKEIQNFIYEAAKFKTMQLIVFSGGECFLLGKDLDRAITTATELGLRTRCVTNGYWATSEEAASDRLTSLLEAGLGEINFSTGDFHQEWIPQSNIVHGAVASIRLGITTGIMIELQKERQVTAANLLAEPQIKDMLETKNGTRFKIVESPWMPMSSSERITQNPNACSSLDNIDRRGGCTSVLASIAIDPNGCLGACCGLVRELIPEMNVKLTPDKSLQEHYFDFTTDFMKIWLFVEGPERIMAWASSKDNSIRWEGEFAHPCHTCLELFENDKIRNLIQSMYHEKVEEVLLRYSLKARLHRIVIPSLYSNDVSDPRSSHED